MSSDDHTTPPPEAQGTASGTGYSPFTLIRGGQYVPPDKPPPPEKSGAPRFTVPPPKFKGMKPSQVGAFLEAVRNGLTIDHACRWANVSSHQVNMRRKYDLHFSVLTAEALIEGRPRRRIRQAIVKERLRQLLRERRDGGPIKPA
jgi:hypothetical protein